MAIMTPERRARQAAIMRERWATRRPEMDAILARAQAGRAASGNRGWQAYHAQVGHDGGYSAALADGAHDRAYHVVRTLDYWEALNEPPWDIGWGDRGQSTAPAQLPADAVLERHDAYHADGRHWAGWVIRRPDDPPDMSVAEMAAARRQQRQQAARLATQYVCRGCARPVLLPPDARPPGVYAPQCLRCGAVTFLAVY